MATVVLSSILTPYARNQVKVEITGKTLFAVLINLIRTFPGLRRHLFDIHGELTKQMHFYVNEETIQVKHWQNIPVQNHDVISILLTKVRSVGKVSDISIFNTRDAEQPQH